MTYANCYTLSYCIKPCEMGSKILTNLELVKGSTLVHPLVNYVGGGWYKVCKAVSAQEAQRLLSGELSVTDIDLSHSLQDQIDLAMTVARKFA